MSGQFSLSLEKKLITYKGNILWNNLWCT